MDKLKIDLGDGKAIRIGYRTPGLGRTHTPRQRVELAVELGMEVIEPQLRDTEFPDLQAAKDMRAAADELGVSIPSMGIGPEVPLTDAAALKELPGHIERAIEYARTLGATWVFARAMKPSEDVPQEETWGVVEESCRTISDMLGQAGIRFAIEADPPCFIHTLERLAWALDRIDHPNCYPNFDPTNLYVTGSNPLDAFDMFGERIISGHIKDGLFRIGERIEKPVGTGEVPYPAIFTELVRRGLGVNMHIEHVSEADEVRAAAAYIRGVLEQVKAG